MAGRKNKAYSDAEVAIIVEEIHNYPTNLSHAFEEASYKLRGRSANGIANYYNRVLKHKTTLMAIATPHGMMTNVKNSPRKASGKVEMVKTFLSMMSDKERKEIAIELFKEL